MRRFILYLILLSFVYTPFSYSQVTTDTLHKRLYYTCKVWGYVKYFHSEVAKGNLNWDTELFSALTNVKNDTSNQDFNNTLLTMINHAGEMTEPDQPLPQVHDSLKYNLDIAWLKDHIFYDDIKTKLDTITSRFRPQENYYVTLTQYDILSVETDNQFYQWGGNPYPSEEYRLLALFRYWNIINYFFPYKYMMDQNWDSTLVEFIPRIKNASNAVSYQMEFSKLVTRLNDAHAVLYSEAYYENIYGYYKLPLTLKYIENETVITGVFVVDDNIRIGDIIKSVNGVDIYSFRDSLRQFTAGSNNASLERNINDRIINGPSGNVQMVLENQSGQKNVSIARNLNWTQYSETIKKTGPIWEKIQKGNQNIGFVDMDRLEIEHIESMFADLWDTDKIIFDLRNYPNLTMYNMINYLFDEPVHFANGTSPDVLYPGTLYWDVFHWGEDDFSQTYRNPIVILIDEHTQSQAELHTMLLEQHPKAIKLGSQTAGADGNGIWIYLPGGIQTMFSGLGIYYPDNAPTQRVGIIPDYNVYPTIQGIRDSTDEVLDFAINLITDIVKKNGKLPSEFKLSQNYPNPFNSKTIINYELRITSEIELSVYNILGQKVSTLISGKQKAGRHKVEWDANSLVSGIYFYRLITDKGFAQSRKLILLK